MGNAIQWIIGWDSGVTNDGIMDGVQWTNG